MHVSLDSRVVIVWSPFISQERYPVLLVDDWSLLRNTHTHTLTHKVILHPTLPRTTRQQAKDTGSCSEDGHT